MTESPKNCIIDDSTPFPMEANGLLMWKCAACGLMWRQSFDLGLVHYEDADGGFSASKERLQRRNIKDRIRCLRRHISLEDTCDVGGSKGYFVEELVEQGYRRVFGIDPNKVQVESAQKRGVPMYIGSTKDASDLFAKHGTNNASLFHVIEHLEDPAEVLGEIRRALPVGGCIIVETPDFSSYIFNATGYRHKLVYPEHTFYFTLHNLQTVLEKNGFRIIYAGKRDFDQYHLNAHESLSRLGFLKKGEALTLTKRLLVRLCSLFLRVPLSLAVKWLGRQNFSLVIGQKV